MSALKRGKSTWPIAYKKIGFWKKEQTWISLLTNNQKNQF
jgi:hypothetical protein